MRELYNSLQIQKSLGLRIVGRVWFSQISCGPPLNPSPKLDPFTFKLGPKLSLRPSVLRLGVSCGIHIKFFGPTIGVHELG